MFMSLFPAVCLNPEQRCVLRCVNPRCVGTEAMADSTGTTKTTRAQKGLCQCRPSCQLPWQGYELRASADLSGFSPPCQMPAPSPGGMRGAAKSQGPRASIRADVRAIFGSCSCDPHMKMLIIYS